MHFFSSAGRPFGARVRRAARRMKAREAHFVGRVDGQHLACEIAGQLGDGQPKAGELGR